MPATRSRRRRLPATLATAATLLGLSALIILSLVFAIRSLSQVSPSGQVSSGLSPLALAVSAPGRFLFESFSWMALFVPVYLLAGMVLLFARSFRRRSAILLALSTLPFLTLSLLIHVLSSSQAYLPQILLGAFGQIPAALLLFLLLGLELVLMLVLPQAGAGKGEDHAEGAGESRVVVATSAECDPVPAVLRMSHAPASPQDAPDEESAPRAEESEAADEEDLDELEEAIDEAGEEINADVPPATTGTAPHLPAADRPAALSQALAAPAGDERVTRMEPGPHPQQPEATQQLALGLDLGPEAKRPPYAIPVDGVLKRHGRLDYGIVDSETKRAAAVLVDALREFNIEAEVTGIRKGPVITLYEVLPAPGVRVSKIANLADNIALRLAAPSVRIVAPIPGKHAVGIEVPNRERAIVSFREMVDLPEMQDNRYEIPIALGKDILGGAQVIDLVQTPHILIGGATNSGKSVLVNAVVCSILFRRPPDAVRLFLVDPKIVELKAYNGVPHLLTPVITDPRKAFQALQYCISEMERRYTLLDALGARDIRVFNRKAKKQRVSRLPYLVVVIDEFADLMATTGKELESTLARLAAMARAVGIHLVLATQRPSIDVITGLIKANIPSRIAFMVANKFDSRIIIDGVGAEKLLGRGDMLFSAAWNPFPARIQGAFVDEEEIEAITGHLKTEFGEPQYIDDEVFFEEEDTAEYDGEAASDPLFERALEIVVQQGKASASYIQRRLKIGYNRSARLVEEMELRGIVGPAQGSKPREIIHIPKGNA